MKRIVLFIGIAMLMSLASIAQEIENKPFGNNLEKLNQDKPVTDTLEFSFPNDGKLVLFFNSTEYQVEELKEKFEEVLKKTTKFPEMKTLYYRLSEDYPQTELDEVILRLEKNYLPFTDQLELGLVLGMEYTGGFFTPNVGGRVMLNFRKFNIGGTITNKVYFPEKIDTNIKVNSNWFANMEFQWDRKDPISNKDNTFGMGILVNNAKSQLFQGTTIQAYYRRKINNNFSISVGIIGTENLTTFYPTVGIQFW